MTKGVKIVIISIFALVISACTSEFSPESKMPHTNQPSPNKMLLVLSAPSIDEAYYAPAFQEIVDFQIAYAKTIMGKDNVVVIVDEKTRAYYEDELPEDILLTAEVYDIWMRDFTTVNPEYPIQFTYTWASMTEGESREVQNSFIAFADQHQITREPTDLLLDGGNVVDNYAGRVITTTRFMENNDLSYDEAKDVLMDLLGATEVAILEPDEEVLAHSDGMVSWIDEDVLLVNDYSSEPEFRKVVMDELLYAFPDVEIIEVPVEYGTNPPGEWEGFESACGVNLNLVLTYENLYVPVFGMAHDDDALAIIAENTTKNVIPVNAKGVCGMGGSVRCLTWQITGENAEKLILAARENE
jgi:agmatine/peptidylarginine deiminase